MKWKLRIIIFILIITLIINIFFFKDRISSIDYDLEKDGVCLIPNVLSKSEIEKMTGVVEEVNRKSRDLYMVGEEVTVKNGPFSNFKGKIQIIDFEKDKVKLEVFIFGRSTIIDLTTDDISK